MFLENFGKFEERMVVSGAENNSHFLDKFVISKDSVWKGLFDMVMLVASCYNVFS